MQIELDNDVIDKIINCVRYTMDHFSGEPMWIEYQMIIETLEMQRAEYNRGGTFGQFMEWAVPPQFITETR